MGYGKGSCLEGLRGQGSISSAPTVVSPCLCDPLTHLGEVEKKKASLGPLFEVVYQSTNILSHQERVTRRYLCKGACSPTIFIVALEGLVTLPPWYHCGHGDQGSHYDLGGISTTEKQGQEQT